VPELSYSPHAREAGSNGRAINPRLDLVLSSTASPTGTLERKSEFKQSVENASANYRQDRPRWKDPLTRQARAAADLQTRRAGALCRRGQNEVAMTHQAAGKDTFFSLAVQPRQRGRRRRQPDCPEDDSQLRHPAYPWAARWFNSLMPGLKVFAGRYYWPTSEEEKKKPSEKGLLTARSRDKGRGTIDFIFPLNQPVRKSGSTKLIK